MQGKKETHPCALEWRRLSPTRREKVLTDLEIGKTKFTLGYRPKELAEVHIWWNLPIPVRTELEDAFQNGRFSKAAKERHLQSIKAIIALDDTLHAKYG